MYNSAHFSLLVVEASQPGREALADTLSRTGHFERVVGTGSISAAKQAAQEEGLNVALIERDIQEGDEGAWNLVRHLRTMTPPIPCLAIAEEWQDTAVIEAFSQGAKGVFTVAGEYLPILCKALACIHIGQVWANSDQLNQTLEHLVARASNGETPDALAALSSREKEIVDLLAQGASNRKIARALHISERTVKNHLASIFKKIGVNSRVQAVLRVVRGT